MNEAQAVVAYCLSVHLCHWQMVNQVPTQRQGGSRRRKGRGVFEHE